MTHTTRLRAPCSCEAGRCTCLRGPTDCFPALACAGGYSAVPPLLRRGGKTNYCRGTRRRRLCQPSPRLPAFFTTSFASWPVCRPQPLSKLIGFFPRIAAAACPGKVVVPKREERRECFLLFFSPQPEAETRAEHHSRRVQEHRRPEQKIFENFAEPAVYAGGRALRKALSNLDSLSLSLSLSRSNLFSFPRYYST